MFCVYLDSLIARESLLFVLILDDEEGTSVLIKGQGTWDHGHFEGSLVSQHLSPELLQHVPKKTRSWKMSGDRKIMQSQSQ